MYDEIFKCFAHGVPHFIVVITSDVILINRHSCTHTHHFHYSVLKQQQREYFILNYVGGAGDFVQPGWIKYSFVQIENAISI